MKERERETTNKFDSPAGKLRVPMMSTRTLIFRSVALLVDVVAVAIAAVVRREA